MPKQNTVIQSYLKGLAPDRRELVEAIRSVIAKNIDGPFEGGIYLFCVYCDPKEQALFVSEWKQTGCRLDEPHESFRGRRRSPRKPASTASCTSPHRYQTPAQ